MRSSLAGAIRRLLTLPALLAAMLLAATALTTAAASAVVLVDDEVIADPGGGEISAELALAPTCLPKAGFHYKITPHNVPEDQPNHVFDVRLYWRQQGDALAQVISNQLDGFVASGSGAFEAKVAVHGLLNGNEYTAYDGEWQKVSVICDFKQPEPRPYSKLGVEPTCSPKAGMNYEVTAHELPEEPDHYRFHWRRPGEQFQVAMEPSGFVATGEGAFEVRGLVIHDGHGYYTPWTDVVVTCPAKGGDPGDDIVPGDPNFTG